MAASSGVYNKRIKLQVNKKTQTALGVKDNFEYLKTFTGACEYKLTRYDSQGQVTGEIEPVWIIRTRNNITFDESMGDYRFVVGKMYLYPKMNPILKGDEYMVTAEEQEDVRVGIL